MILSQRQRTIMQVLFLVGLVFGIYWPCLHGGFIWDDVNAVINNPAIHARDGLIKIWFSHQTDDYWPITYSIFWFAFRIFKDSTLGYHILNIAIHCMNALLLWAILKRLSFKWSYWAALIFAAHPVNTEAVAWIFQLKTTLSSGLAWLAFWYWIQFEDYKKKKHLAYSILSFIFSLLTKPTAITLPIIYVGYNFFKKRKFQWKENLSVLPFFFLSLIFGILNIFYWTARAVPLPEEILASSPLVRLLEAAHAILFYFFKTLFPWKLSFVYPFWNIQAQDILSYIPAVALIITLGFLFWFWKKQKNPLLTVVFYVITALIPVIGVFEIYFMKYSFVADHWQYMAIIGNIVIILFVINKLFRHVFIPILIVAILSVLTFQRASIFKDETTLWKSTLQVNSNSWFVYNKLGILAANQNDLDTAIEDFRAALKIKPNAFEIFNNLGNCYFLKGNYDLASESYQSALKLYPEYPNAKMNLAITLEKTGQYAQAAAYMENALLALNPSQKTDAYFELGKIYLKLQQKSEAISALQEALKTRPDRDDIKKILGEIQGTN